MKILTKMLDVFTKMEPKTRRTLIIVLGVLGVAFVVVAGVTGNFDIFER